MITYKQYNFCRKIGLPPIPHVERYFAMTHAGLAVTGAGALGGALIGNLKYNSDKKKLQREGKDTSHLSRAKYLIGGTALGGAAGYGLNTIMGASKRVNAVNKEMDAQTKEFKDKMNALNTKTPQQQEAENKLKNRHAFLLKEIEKFGNIKNPTSEQLKELDNMNEEANNILIKLLNP